MIGINMDMPKYCGECKCVYKRNYLGIKIPICGITHKDVNIDKYADRNNLCPLINLNEPKTYDELLEDEWEEK